MTLAGMEEVEVVVAHSERATLRVGTVFLKIDADRARTDIEVEAMAMAPVPTPEVLWRRPPVLALAAVGGTALGHLGEPSAASPAAWAAAGAALRALHEAPLPALARLRLAAVHRAELPSGVRPRHQAWLCARLGPPDAGGTDRRHRRAAGQLVAAALAR